MNQYKLLVCLSLTLNSLSSVFKLFLILLIKTTDWIEETTNCFFWYQLKTVLFLCFLDSFLSNYTLNFIIHLKFAKIFLKQITPPPSCLRSYILTTIYFLCPSQSHNEHQLFLYGLGKSRLTDCEYSSVSVSGTSWPLTSIRKGRVPAKCLAVPKSRFNIW